MNENCNAYIDELEHKLAESYENFLNKSRKNIIVYPLFLTIIVVLFVIIVGILGNKGFNINFESIVEKIYWLCMVVLFVYFIVWCIYSIINKFVNKGQRTELYIKCAYNENLELKINNILNKLNFKKIEYNNEIVYCATKTETNINSVISTFGPRYIKYEIKNNFLLITCWIKINGIESPIDKKIGNKYGIIDKFILIREIKVIKDLLNDSSYKIN